MPFFSLLRLLVADYSWSSFSSWIQIVRLTYILSHFHKPMKFFFSKFIDTNILKSNRKLEKMAYTRYLHYIVIDIFSITRPFISIGVFLWNLLFPMRQVLLTELNKNIYSIGNLKQTKLKIFNLKPQMFLLTCFVCTL